MAFEIQFNEEKDLIRKAVDSTEKLPGFHINECDNRDFEKIKRIVFFPLLAFGIQLPKRDETNLNPYYLI